MVDEYKTYDTKTYYNKPTKKNELEKEFIKYENFVYSYAERIFNEKIKPYLDRHNLIFLSGNGTYFIDRRDTPVTGSWIHGIDPDTLPKSIQKWLNLEIPGMNNSLGSVMPNYK